MTIQKEKNNMNSHLIIATCIYNLGLLTLTTLTMTRQKTLLIHQVAAMNHVAPKLGHLVFCQFDVFCCWGINERHPTIAQDDEFNARIRGSSFQIGGQLQHGSEEQLPLPRVKPSHFDFESASFQKFNDFRYLSNIVNVSVQYDEWS